MKKYHYETIFRIVVDGRVVGEYPYLYVARVAMVAAQEKYGYWAGGPRMERLRRRVYEE